MPFSATHPVRAKAWQNVASAVEGGEEDAQRNQDRMPGVGVGLDSNPTVDGTGCALQSGEPRTALPSGARKQSVQFGVAGSKRDVCLAFQDPGANSDCDQRFRVIRPNGVGDAA